MAQRIGIYPGTFDPVHDGHVAFALETKRICRLDEIIFLPERFPRGKSPASSLPERITQLEAALQAEGLGVAQLASERFTVQETLPELERMFAGAELTLLLGSDMVHTLTYRWEGLGVLFSALRLAIGMRAGDTSEEIAAILTSVGKTHGKQPRHTLIYTDKAHLSSSQFRAVQ